jgi:hypothetical protein
MKKKKIHRYKYFIHCALCFEKGAKKIWEETGVVPTNRIFIKKTSLDKWEGKK